MPQKSCRSLGLHAIVDFLVIEHPPNVHSRAFVDKVTPQHLASRWGHTGVIRMLIELGADVTAQNKIGLTPLHLASQVEVTHVHLERGADAVTLVDSVVYGATKTCGSSLACFLSMAPM